MQLIEGKAYFGFMVLEARNPSCWGGVAARGRSKDAAFTSFTTSMKQSELHAGQGSNLSRLPLSGTPV